jgi:hypothetical protein
MHNLQWQKMGNLLFELDKKIVSKDANPTLQRIYDKMKAVIEEEGIYVYNPIGEKYSETRTDVDANITGTATNNLIIADVIKPVLYMADGDKKILLQKGVVIVEGR